MSNYKISQLTAGGIPRVGDLFESSQGATPASTSVTAQQIIPGPDLAPTTAGSLDDEFHSSATLPGGGSAIWTWDNQNSATATINQNHLNLASITGSGDNLTSLLQATPSTPWTVRTKAYLCCKGGTNYHLAGIVLKDSVSGKYISFTIGWDSALVAEVFGWTNVTTVGTVLSSEAIFQRMLYLQVQDDGTNLNFSYSENGVTWRQTYSGGRTAYLTNGANHVGVGLDCHDSSNITIGDFQWFRRTQ